MAADLPSVVAACDPGTPAGLRDRAVILLGFALLARRAELAALSVSDVEHVTGEGLAVTIRASKTDQSARGLVRRIHYASAEAVCPVRAVLAWLEYLAGQGVTTGPLFTRVDRWGNLGPGAGGRYRPAPRPGGRPHAALQSAGGEPDAETEPGRGPEPNGVPPGPASADCAEPGDGDVREGRDGRLRPQAIGDIVAAACRAAGLAGSRHGRWADGSRAFAGYVEEATGFGDTNPTKGLL
jgi:hypothetical protein